MQTNILEYLEETVKRLPDKLAYADDREGLTFHRKEQRLSEVIYIEGSMRRSRSLFS